MAAVALLVALWRPGSALWRIRLNPASVRQRWALMAFLAPLAIYTTVRIVGEFLVSGPLVFPNPHGYTYDFDQYDHVAQSLLNGRVWLDLPVSPELAQAANPHDILVRSQLFESGKTQIFWDYAFYGGHWYSYFGVVPVVLFFLPFRAITSLWTPGGMMLPTSVCILLMMFLFAVFACLLVIRLTHRLCPNASVAATSIVIVMFLLGSNASYLHFRLNFYSVPFAASLMFTTLGLWLWLKATPEPGDVVGHQRQHHDQGGDDDGGRRSQGPSRGQGAAFQPLQQRGDLRPEDREAQQRGQRELSLIHI